MSQKKDPKHKKTTKKDIPVSATDEVVVPQLPTSLSEELEAILKKNPKHFYGCGG